MTRRTKSQSYQLEDVRIQEFLDMILRLGLIGDEFKTARLHLLEHLDGCIAWKDPAQA